MVKMKDFRVKVYTRRGIPIHVNTFDVKASNLTEAKRKVKLRVKKENRDKPRGYFYLDVYKLIKDDLTETN